MLVVFPFGSFTDVTRFMLSYPYVAAPLPVFADVTTAPLQSQESEVAGPAGGVMVSAKALHEFEP
jgi:hypothetical protein